VAERAAHDAGRALKRLAAAALLAAAAAAHADSTGYCSPGRPLDASQKDVVLRFGAAVKAELERAGSGVALISRSGLDLSRFSMRYSHAGLSLRDSADSRWAVRQLYYACDDQRPRVFDQGISAFLLGANDAALGYVSIVFLPPEAAAAVERRARDDRAALAVLADRYSANAYPFALAYQNCNQWVAELMASAWGDAATRAEAQAWLQRAGYVPTAFEVGPMIAASLFVPFLHRDDHPEDDLAAGRFKVSMPASLETFVRQRWPEATRVELCHDGRQVVVKRGWGSIAEGCRPSDGDEATPLP